MDNAASQAYLYCPTDAECNITCVPPTCLDGGTFIDARPSSVLNFFEFIETSDQITKPERISEIWCPVDTIGGSQNCNVYVSSPQGFVTLNEVEFHAVEGVHDLKFICDTNNCTYFDASGAPIVRCLEDYSASCTLGVYPLNHLNATPSAVDYRCNNASICNTYLLPTPSPTTAEPSIAPTVQTLQPSIVTIDPTAVTQYPTSQTTDQTNAP
eukprot:958653_1